MESRNQENGLNRRRRSLDSILARINSQKNFETSSRTLSADLTLLTQPADLTLLTNDHNHNLSEISDLTLNKSLAAPILQLPPPAAIVTSATTVTFVHYYGTDIIFDSSLHRVMFWGWHKEQVGYLAFLNHEEWFLNKSFKGKKHIAWLHFLNQYAVDHPEGSNVPLVIIQGFLGLADYNLSTCTFAACIPGLDSDYFLEENVKRQPGGRYAFKIVDKVGDRFRFVITSGSRVSGWISYPVVQKEKRKLPVQTLEAPKPKPKRIRSVKLAPTLARSHSLGYGSAWEHVKEVEESNSSLLRAEKARGDVLYVELIGLKAVFVSRGETDQVAGIDEALARAASVKDALLIHID